MQKILTGVIIVVFALFLYNFFLMPPSFTNGTEAPNIQSELISGEEFSLEELRGNYVLIDFWGSWCGPCKREIPQLKQLYTEFNDQSFKDAEGFEVLSIALEKSEKFTRKIIKDRGLDWPYHIIDISRVVMLSSIAQDYDVKELPTKFLINPKGQIIGTDLPYEEMSKLLRARLN